MKKVRSEEMKHSTIRLLLLLAVALLLNACSDDPETEQLGQRKVLAVEPYYASFLNVEKITRSLPDGFTLYENLYPSTIASQATIGLFQTYPSSTGSVPVSSTVKYVNETWTTTQAITISTKPCYIYGFMPSNSDFVAGTPTAAPLNGNFANGAIINIPGLSTLSPADVCVVVGAAKGKSTNDITTTGVIKPGNFSYDDTTGDDGSEKIYLLLDHLYAGLHFKMHLDADYANLRSVVVKEVKLTTLEKISTTIDLTVHLTANSTGASPLTSVNYSTASSAVDYATITLFPYDENITEFSVPVNTPQDFLSCFAPGSCHNFELTSTYDVYDKQGNLIRRDCVAHNKINTAGFYGYDNLRAGEIYTINLKIQPTFLYVLSDPDVDNPTIVISNN